MTAAESRSPERRVGQGGIRQLRANAATGGQEHNQVAVAIGRSSIRRTGGHTFGPETLPSQVGGLLFTAAMGDPTCHHQQALQGRTSVGASAQRIVLRRATTPQADPSISARIAIIASVEGVHLGRARAPLAFGPIQGVPAAGRLAGGAVGP